MGVFLWQDPHLAYYSNASFSPAGLVLTYAYFCDASLRTPDRRLPWLYSAVGLTGYHIGLVLVFVLLLVMERGQPALLMLIPCVLAPFFVVAAARRELGVVWHGVPLTSGGLSRGGDAEGDDPEEAGLEEKE